MSIEVKQKIKEVADDFAMPAKKLIEIVGKFYEKPKSSSQNLTEDQLNVIFDYITQQNQIDSIEQVFAAAAAKKEAPAPAPAPAPAAPAAPAAQNKPAAPAQSNQPRPQQQNQQPRPQQNNVQRPAQPQNNQNNQNAQRPQQPNAQQQPKQPQPERKRERRVIDTSAVTVNADRYDDRVDSLVSDRVQNYQSGKQKIGNKNKKQQQAKRFGNKSRSEEQEKMRRLQLEIAKKAQLVVKIPDEITVGELASRMKKTAAEVIKCLLKNGVMATVNQTIDFDTAEFVATELGCKVEHEVIVTIEERLFDDHQDTADELVTRPPVVVVMGHVDHGKTSPARLYPPREGRGRRSRRHHAAHRRLHRRDQRPAHHLPRHPGPRGLHRDARARRDVHRYRHSRRRRGRRHHAADHRGHQPRQGGQDPHHRGRQQDG